jgi:hypothetical protein
VLHLPEEVYKESKRSKAKSPQGPVRDGMLWKDWLLGGSAVACGEIRGF